MNLKIAISFLSKHQPFPDDDDLDQQTLDDWLSVRTYLKQNPSEECVPLLLNCFGRMDGCGSYCDVELLLSKCNPTIVIDSLKTSLRSPNEAVRFWSCEIASNYKTSRLYPELEECLQDQDEGVRLAAVTPVSQQEPKFALPLLNARLLTEKHPLVIDAIQAAIRDIERR
ncbi:MAG: hypothetical protein JWM11_4872 [Planctomycetaceae bacterium]|nr:hypothetical protein [Planctomycetaceae bacterium]